MELSSVESTRVSRFVNEYKNKEDKRTSLFPVAISIIGLIIIAFGIIYSSNNMNNSSLVYIYYPTIVIGITLIVLGIINIRLNKKVGELIFVAKILDKILLENKQK